jgi:AraC-like DNA-binding protein
MLELGRYVIERFSAECPVFMLRTFPRLLLYELHMLKAGVTACYPSAMQRMLEIIEHYLEDRIDMEMLTGVSLLSQPTIYRMFKTFFGVTPRGYIEQRRMERAAQLLRRTGLQIRQIARRLQYENPFYFSKCFKEYFGLAPRQWRNSTEPAPVQRPCREASSHHDLAARKHWFYIPDSDGE